MTVDTEKFKEAVESRCEVPVDFNELIQNIMINEDGNIESTGGGLYVLMSPDYEILEMAGGVSPEASQQIMNDIDECDNRE